MMRIFITGASGMLGTRLVRLASKEHDVWGCYRSVRVDSHDGRIFPLDITDEDQVKESLLRLKPEAIVHTAAWTDVDGCERDAKAAERINVEGTKRMAQGAAEAGAALVYISTDYVFDGEKGNYVESDPPFPLCVYGRTKLEGEEAVRSFCPKSLVIRTSIFGSNFQRKRGPVESILGHLRAGKRLERFSDQFSSPIYTGDLSRIVLDLLAGHSEGLFHVGGKERLSRYDFAAKIAEVFGFPRDQIRSVPFKPLPGFARRPRDSSLFGGKVERDLGVCLPNVEDGLRRLKEDCKFISESSLAG